MAWEKYRPTPGKNTVRYRNTETGETRSRRQQEKSTLNPTKYNQYYRRGVTKRDTKKYTAHSNTKHKITSVTRFQDLQNLLNGQKPPKVKGDLTAFVRITDHKTGKQWQTDSAFVAIGGGWRDDLRGAVNQYLRAYIFQVVQKPEDADDDDLTDEEHDDLEDAELEYELVFVSDL